jgi:hypothetical protein
MTRRNEEWSILLGMFIAVIIFLSAAVGWWYGYAKGAEEEGIRMWHNAKDNLMPIAEQILPSFCNTTEMKEKTGCSHKTECPRCNDCPEVLNWTIINDINWSKRSWSVVPV